MTSELVVQLSSLEGLPGAQRELSRTGFLEELTTSTVAVSADEPVVFDGGVEWIDGGRVVITGKVATSWTGECQRCLTSVVGAVSAEVREIFEPEPTEGETYLLKGDVVDLEPMMREAVVLEFPLTVLCKPECVGLCPVCGINKNEATCDCDTTIIDPRWAALDQFRTENS